MSELTVDDAEPQRGRDFRTLLPGLGTGGVLVALVVVAFVGLAGFVAFNGMPQRSSEASQSETLIPSTAPEVAATLAIDAGAPADTPADVPAGAAAAAAAADPATAAPGAATPGGGNPATGGGGDGDAPPGIGTGLPPVSGSPPASPADPAPAPVEGGVGGVVQEVDDTVAGATGINPGLGGITKPITDPIDDTINGVTGDLGLGEVVPPVDLPDVKVPGLSP